MDGWTEEQLLTKLERIAQAQTPRRSRHPMPRGVVRRIQEQIDYNCENLDRSLRALERNTR